MNCTCAASKTVILEGHVLAGSVAFSFVVKKKNLGKPLQLYSIQTAFTKELLAASEAQKTKPVVFLSQTCSSEPDAAVSTGAPGDLRRTHHALGALRHQIHQALHPTLHRLHRSSQFPCKTTPWPDSTVLLVVVDSTVQAAQLMLNKQTATQEDGRHSVSAIRGPPVSVRRKQTI